MVLFKRNKKEDYPIEITDILLEMGAYYVAYKYKMMPHDKKIRLAKFLNDDTLVSTTSPLEIRALTQLECFYRSESFLEIDSEKFSTQSKTYEIIVRHKLHDELEAVKVDNIPKVISGFSPEEAFKLGYSYALRSANVMMQNGESKHE